MATIYKVFLRFCVVRGDPRVVSERMSYQVWLATPGSYQVWLATPGDHSGDREVRNHWNGHDLQGFPTFLRGPRRPARRLGKDELPGVASNTW